MALTLIEASKINDGDVKRSAIIEMFAENSDILRVLPFEDIPGGSLSYNLEGKLPGVAFRGFNEGYSESTGIINPQVEVLKIAGGDLDVDAAMIKTRGEQVRSAQEAMKVKALSLYLTKKIITGDSEVDPREFDGLRKRITGDQLVPASLAAPNANSPLSLEALDAAIDRVDNPTHLLMSKDMRRKLSVAARNPNVAGDISYDLDEFGRRVMSYNGLPILIADYDDEGKRILDFNEAGPAGGSTSTSIYVLSVAPGMLTGLQNGVMEVEDLGKLQEKPVFRTRVEWLVGMAAMHGRAASRIWGITSAAVAV
ncbi:major capsid protein [Microcystis phage Mwe-JY26]